MICGVFITAFAVAASVAPHEGDAKAPGPALDSDDFSPIGDSVQSSGRILIATKLGIRKRNPRTLFDCFHETSRRLNAGEHPRRCRTQRLITPIPRSVDSSAVGLPPETRTAPAISTFPGEVVLTAFINPRGSQTRFKFQYGRIKAYGTFTEASEEVLNGDHWIEIAESLCCKRLSSKTTFHYRVIAFNRYGSVHGQDRTFRTTRAHSAVRSSPVSALARSEAELATDRSNWPRANSSFR